ncbi:hypothetical protein VNO77_39367 [Canavalia gladiata]|uniref:Uncharacterized protein n=1 Tax=Canavalia gladiata TaxID=3824 RepID=A0AAN9KAC1_CANGL
MVSIAYGGTDLFLITCSSRPNLKRLKIENMVVGCLQIGWEALRSLIWSLYLSFVAAIANHCHQRCFTYKICQMGCHGLGGSLSRVLALQELKLIDFNALVSLPQYMMEGNDLQNLRHREMKGSPELVSFPNALFG